MMTTVHMVPCSPGHNPNTCDAEEDELGQWSGDRNALVWSVKKVDLDTNHIQR